MPSFVKGMFSSGIIIPSTPFCPCLEACLSPYSGFFIFKNLTLQIIESSPDNLLDIYTLSTVPYNELSVLIDTSVYIVSLTCSMNTPLLTSL